MTNWCALSSLFLICCLTACGSEQVVTRTKIVEVRVVERVTVPESLLAPCPMIAWPAFGITWAGILDDLAVKHRQQIACNERFDVIREWQDAPENIRPEDGDESP